MPFSSLKAHQYFFAYAEVEYNEKSAKLEATLTLTAHDFEANLQKDLIITNPIDKAFLDSVELAEIEKRINQQLILTTEEKSNEIRWVSRFKIDGYHQLLNGNLEIYLSCDAQIPISTIIVQFNLMMDHFPDQQNKLTFINKRKKSTLNFTINNQIQILTI